MQNNRKDYFKFPKYNGSKIPFMQACLEYIRSGKKHKGARMRIIDGFFRIRSWNKVFHRWEWEPVVETPQHYMELKKCH